MTSAVGGSPGRGEIGALGCHRSSRGDEDGALALALASAITSTAGEVNRLDDGAALVPTSIPTMAMTTEVVIFLQSFSQSFFRMTT